MGEMNRVVFDFYGVIYDPKRGEINPEVLNIIESLYEQNILLYIFTNSSLKALERNDKQIPFLKYFKEVIHKYSKPYPESFEELFNTLECDTSEIILVDDDMNVIEQAQEYGIRTIRYSKIADLRTELEDFLGISLDSSN
jgi:HAD superfamily hydrolase (TIGR01509 family)